MSRSVSLLAQLLIGALSLAACRQAVPAAGANSNQAAVGRARLDGEEIDEADEEGEADETALSAGADGSNDADPDAQDVEVEDDFEEAPVAASESIRPPHPLDGVSAAEVLRRLREAPASLGSMSLGRSNGGALINGERLPDSPHWQLMDSGHAYGTSETVGYITAAVAKLVAEFPDAPPMFVGDVSAARGGHISPHRSHQAGQDADIGYFYTTKHQWYQLATAANLDRPKTWALVRAFITQSDVRMLFMDHSVQTLLKDYALQIGEDAAWIESIFGVHSAGGPLIRHAPGHATHFHVRFFNPIAEETARRCYAGLLALGRVPAPSYMLEYTAKKGDSLNSLAKRYGVSVKELRRINGMRGKVLYAKRVYKVPRRGPAAMPPATRLPPRRLPKFTPAVRAPQAISSAANHNGS